ncbi:hypothetical protein GCM10022234_16060 [Aeromicrobium panaciterrae]|uniref:hypothetical protein n=1 Tax=Aeromicrobium panaciterrae TaxID=363861 RepID=UPI0031E3751E
MSGEDWNDEAPDQSQDTGYTFEPASAQLAVNILEDCFAEGADYLEAAHRLHAITRPTEASPAAEPNDAPDPAPPLPLMNELERALMYELAVPFDGPVTCELGLDDGDSAFVWPPRIRHVTDDVVRLWTFLASALNASAARARFSDLAFRRGVDPVALSQLARDAYLEFGEVDEGFDIDHAHALIRAWTLDRTFRRVEGEEQCRVVMAEVLVSSWDSARRVAGVLLPILGALCRTSLAPSEDPVGVDALLERAGELYFNASSVTYIAELKRARVTTESARLSISEWEIERLAEEARASSGLVKVVRLRDVIERARQLQLIELSRALTAELQALPADDVELESIESTISISRLVMEFYFRQFTRDRDWRNGFMRFAHLPPPTGSIEDLRSAAEERLLRPRVVDIFTTVLLDNEMLPTWTPSSDDTRAEWITAREASFKAAVAGDHHAEILMRLQRRYGSPPVDELVALIAFEGRGNTGLAEVFARALHHFWDGDLEACVHIAVPRIESACRLLLKELDVGIYQVQLGDRPGVYPPLGVLLDSLADLDLDESWLYFLRWLLVNHAGKNLRNEIAHGKVAAVSSSEAALCLRALLLVVMLCGPGSADNIEADLARDVNGAGDVSASAVRDLRGRIRQPIDSATGVPSGATVAVAVMVGAAVGSVRRLIRRLRP